MHEFFSKEGQELVQWKKAEREIVAKQEEGGRDLWLLTEDCVWTEAWSEDTPKEVADARQC